MLTTTTTTLFLLALTTHASAQFEIPKYGDLFGLAATGPGIQNVDLRAQRGRLYIGGAQTPSCDEDQQQDFATFVRYSDNMTYLFTHSHSAQQVWVDASGMGQGITGFANVSRDGASTAPRNASFEGFEVDGQGNFTFDGVGAKACPTTEEGKWSVWFTTSETPGFQEGCVGVVLKAFGTPARVACEYTTA